MWKRKSHPSTKSDIVISSDNSIRVDVKEQDDNIEVTVNLKPSFIVSKKIDITESKIVSFLEKQRYVISEILDRPIGDVNNYSGSGSLTATWVFKAEKKKRRYSSKKRTKKQE